MRFITAILTSFVLCMAGCTSPQEIIVIDNGLTGMGIRAEYRCPLCDKRYKTEYLAQKCIDSHD